MNILLVDNDVTSLMDKQRFLESKGLNCDIAKTKNEVEHLILIHNYCCILIDVEIDLKLDFYLFHYIRMFTNKPIIYFGDKSETFPKETQVYLDSKISFENHWSYIKKRIACGMNSPASYYIATLKVDLIEQAAYVSKNKLNLTPLQFNILIYIVEHQNIVLSMDEIYRSVWKVDEENPLETVQVNMSRLRRKLQALEKHYEFISTIRGKGYIFNNPPKTNKKPV